MDTLTTTAALDTLSSDALTARLGELLGTERRCVVDFLRHLAELDRRHGYLDLGFPSLFAYCAEGLRLSNASAYRRTHAARLLARFPTIADYLSDGRLCLTTLVLLKDVLEPDNHRELLDSAASRTEDEVKLLVAQLQPRPDIQDSIRRVPVRPVLLFTPAPEVTATAVPVLGDCPAPQAPADEAAPARPIEIVLPPPPPRVEPLNAERYSLKMSVGKDFLDELEQVKGALSHTVPGGKLEDVLRECFRVTLEACSKRRRGAPAARSSTSTSGPEVAGKFASRSEPTDSTSGPEVAGKFASRSEPTNSTSGPEVAGKFASRSEPTDSTSGPEVPEAIAGELETRGTTVTTTVRSEVLPPAPGPGGTSAVAAPSLDVTVTSAFRCNSAPSTSGPEVATPEPEADAEASGRYLPVEVRREVWARDDGTCTYVGWNGRRCGSTHQLEFHHRVPFALGGAGTVDNVTLHCRAHNQHRARADFGDALMANYSSSR